MLVACCAIGVVATLLAAPAARACVSPPKPGYPTISKISLLTPNINVATAPGQPEIAVTYAVGPSGLASFSGFFNSSSTSQEVNFVSEFYNTAPGSGTLNLQFFGSETYDDDGIPAGLNIYSAPGT
jgi:hypothetical protein